VGNDEAPAAAPTRAVRSLLEWAGVSDTDAERIAGAAPDIVALRSLDEGDERVRRAVEAARLSALHNVSLERARDLVQAGVTLEALAQVDGTAGALALEHGLGPDAIASALEVASRSADAAPELFPDRPPTLTARRTLVLPEPSSWETIARQAYGESGPDVANALAAANRAPADEVVPAGAVVLLPVLDGQDPAEPQPDLARFASYLEEHAAAALATAGFEQAAALAAVDPVIDALKTGVASSTLRRLRLQAVAEQAGIPPEAAHALAMVGGWPSPEVLATAEPATVTAVLDQSLALGLTSRTWEIVNVIEWLGQLGPLVGATATITPIEDPCAAQLPGDAALENMFDYRTTPAGSSSLELAAALEARESFLDEVQAMREANVTTPSAADAYRDDTLRALGVTDQDRQRWITDWGLDLSVEATTSQEAQQKLAMLGRYLSESAEIVALLRDLAEGHESYHRGELGLALAAYGRAERWFVQRLDRVALRSSIAPTVTAPFPSRVQTWYETTRPALTGAAFLDHLQMPFDSYPGYILTPWKDFARPANADEPFRKFLYYLRNVVLPLCRHDCQLELGNFCAALSELLAVRHRAAYTDQLDATAEAAIAAGGPALPPVGEAGLDPAGWGRFGEPLLHSVERRLIDVKVAHLLRRWGEYHERRARPRDAAHPDTRRALARYAQAIRVQYEPWNAMRERAVTTIEGFRSDLSAAAAAPINPVALDDATVAELGLTRLRNGLNYLGYDESYVPIWTYGFLRNSARYFAEHARQLERDALQSLSSAEAEAGNQRLLTQQVGTAGSQLAVEARRVSEANANVTAAQIGQRLATLRRLNNLDRIDEFDRQAPTRMALGVIGGAISGSSLGGGNPYAAVAGIAYGAVSGYLSGSMEQERQRNDLNRTQYELNQASALAAADLARSRISASIARLARRHAACSLAYAQSNLEFATAKTLSADFWYVNARRLREMAREYVDTAIQMAFLTEQALEFDTGRRVDRIKFDYPSTQERLAADALLLDLDSLESDRVFTPERRKRPIRHLVPLRIRDFRAFEELKRTGTLTFDTSVAEFDLAYLGSYMLRLVDLEVEVRALTPPTGIRGVLTKAGLSWLRFSTVNGGGSALNTASDWITETPTPYKIAAVVQADESLVLSTFDLRRDGVVLRAHDEGEARRPFEGSGLGGTWTLTLDPSANEDVDMRTITDVDLVLYLTSQYDPDLAAAVDLERRKQIALGSNALERARGYAFRDTLPDAFYHLLNGADGNRPLERVVAFDVAPEDFPNGQVNRRVVGISIGVLGADGPQPMAFEISSGAHAPAFEASGTATTDASAPGVYAFTTFDQPPEDSWILRLRADDNPSLAVTDAAGQPQRFRVTANGSLARDSAGTPIPDPAGRLIFDDDVLAAAIVDVWWIFRYRYELDGVAGDPVPLWAHFERGPDARFAQAAGGVGSAAWTEEDAAGQWTHAQGAWRRSGAGGGQLRDSAPMTWEDLRVSMIVEPPSTPGAEAGALARYAQGANTGYRLRVRTTAASDAVDLVLERLDAGAVTEFARQDGVAVAPGVPHSLVLECRGDSLRGTLDDAVAVAAVDGGAHLGAGDVAMWGSGHGATFREVLVTDLAGRP
jgi:Tc toxin complex TcA C-terminal TcB-binding domain